MRVFLSWSGPHSHKVALILKEWLPTVIQALDTWVSSADIEKGESWFSAITDSLVKADGVGVFCLTPDNLKAPWLAYEAGALASQDRGRVATFLHHVAPSDVGAPLGLFQATVAGNKDDVLLLLTTLNGRLAAPLPEPRLMKAFETNWTSLEDQLLALIIEKNETSQQRQKPVHEQLDEILNVVRRIEKDALVNASSTLSNLGLGLAGPAGNRWVAASNLGSSGLGGLGLLGLGAAPPTPASLTIPVHRSLTDTTTEGWHQAGAVRSTSDSTGLNFLPPAKPEELP